MHPAAIILQSSSRNLHEMLVCIIIRQGASSPECVQVPSKLQYLSPRCFAAAKSLDKPLLLLDGDVFGDAVNICSAANAEIFQHTLESAQMDLILSS